MCLPCYYLCQVVRQTVTTLVLLVLQPMRTITKITLRQVLQPIISSWCVARPAASSISSRLSMNFRLQAMLDGREEDMFDTAS